MPTLLWSGVNNAASHQIEVAEIKLGAENMFTISPREPKFVEPEFVTAVTAALEAIGGTVTSEAW